MENKNDWFNHTRTAQHAEVGANAVNHRQVLTSDFNLKIVVLARIRLRVLGVLGIKRLCQRETVQVWSLKTEMSIY